MKLNIIIAILFTLHLSCKSNAQTDLESTLEDYRQEILGIWVLEDDPESKIEFLESGIVNRYYGQELRSTENYLVTSSCDGEHQTDDSLVLKLFTNGTDLFCSYIEGLNFEGSNMMSLMTFNQGKIIVYVRP